jgi:prefoldin subunit 5
MGLFANTMRLYACISRQRDLELEAQFIGMHKVQLGNAHAELGNMYGKLDPASEAAKVLEGRIKQLQHAETVLDNQINRIQSQTKILDQEIQTARQNIDKAIKETFGLSIEGA